MNGIWISGVTDLHDLHDLRDYRISVAWIDPDVDAELFDRKWKMIQIRNDNLIGKRWKGTPHSLYFIWIILIALAQHVLHNRMLRTMIPHIISLGRNSHHGNND